MKAGDWVSFWTNTWPNDVTSIRVSMDNPGKTEDITGKGLYMGRGRIVRVRETGAVLVREERSGRLVEVAPNERVEPLVLESRTLTLGDLRQFLEEYREAPDDTPVHVSLPVGFNCDDAGLELEEDHPERHEPNAFEDVPARGITFTAIEQESGDIADSYIPPEEWESGEDWFFAVCILPNGARAHDALRGTDHQ